VTARGFTLIELLIAIAIFALLIMLAGPMYADFMGNTQIRNAAENTLTGVRLAQTQAVRNNRSAKFVIDPTATTGGWSVFLWDENTADYAAAAVDTYGWKEGASRTAVAPLPAAAVAVTFDGLGRVVANGYPLAPDGTASLTRINITNPSVSTPRDLSIIISAVGGTTATKLCDPAVPALPPDPRSCS
jgi:type IV fimbrial biogenesis protein FimT